MAITLITGLPGHGKTLYALQWVRDWAQREGRAVFHNGIRDLKLPWQAIQVEDWQAVEPGGIIVIDECQASFPVRTRGAPPSWIEELAKHRHRGVDFVLITQNPMLFDAFVRRLVDRHFHIVRKFGTHFATVYEFVNGVRENCASNRESAVRHEWRYPKDVFSLYTSAELHTVKRRIPARVWVLALVPVVAGVLIWMAYRQLAPKAGAAAAPGPWAAASAPSAVVQSVRSVDGSGGRAGVMTAEEYVKAYAPRVAGLSYTAPAYDAVTQPAEAPYPAACVQSKTRCQCYTQQGTRLDVPDALCAGIVRGGFFVAWRAPSGQQPQQQSGPLPAGGVATGAVELGGQGYGMAQRRFAPGSVPGAAAGPSSRQANPARSGAPT